MNPHFNKLNSHVQQQPYDLTKKKINTSSPGSRAMAYDYRAYPTTYGNPWAESSSSSVAAMTAYRTNRDPPPAHQKQSYINSAHAVADYTQRQRSTSSLSSSSSSSASALAGRNDAKSTASTGTLSYGTGPSHYQPQNKIPPTMPQQQQQYAPPTSALKAQTISPTQRPSATSAMPSGSRTSATAASRVAEMAQLVKNPVRVERKLNEYPIVPHYDRITLDDSRAVRINYADKSLCANSAGSLIQGTYVSRAEPTNYIYDPKKFPAEFEAKGPTHKYKMDYVISDPKSYTSIFHTFPDQQKYPDNRIQFIHSVKKVEPNRVIEEQRKLFVANDKLTCASIYKLDRKIIEPSASTSSASASSSSFFQSQSSKPSTFKPNVSSKK